MGDEKRYYWLKLKDDFFKSRKMKKLRKVAGGDTYTIIYLKLQLLSINNDGVIEFEGTDEDIFHQLALDIDEEIDDIKMTVAFCTSNDLIELQEQDLFLNNVPQLIGSEGASAKRVRKHRLKQEKQQNKALQSNNPPLQSNTGVTKCNTEIDIDKDIETESRDKSKKDDDSWKTQILSAWNSLDKNIPKIKSLNAGTQRHKYLNARVNQYGTNEVLRAISNIKHSSFLKGYATDFVINFDWFIKPNNFIKVLEGNYKDKETENKTKHNNYAQKAREERFKRMMENNQ